MESYIIESNQKKSSRIPAWLDLTQSGTGLILGLFMWVHMLLVASIILGKGSFNFVAKTMELSFLSDTGHGYPIAVFFAVSGVFTLFILHALLGMRKFPISWQQHRIIRDQMGMMKHQDTNLWYIQVVTGFIMFFAGSVHLYTMLTHPGSIDPYLSADRVVSSNFWFLYLILLVCVELHGTIGLYRLCMKWGWFQGKNFKSARENRKKLKQLKNRLAIFFLSIGVLALLIFIVIGIGHRDRVGEPYQAASLTGESALHEEPAADEEPAVEEDAVQEEHGTETHEALPVEEVHEEEVIPVEVLETEESHMAPEVHESEDAHGEADHSEPEAHDTGHAAEETVH
ncbi:fumarate reductase cytochrome b subunit [Desulfospira joergensenii]|uniref:fumarate reductase cytochrome b subunit n=1 Tax=Desulfospira joergensenii TaxID=53329 RepID=UPI0003B36EDD|nr:fumarate reductase cytochrome b subunit [Desulfospira joergensenii]